MRNEKKIQFRQSHADFPLTVELGEKCPSWGLHRWRGDSGLRFIPSDDEGFTLRGNKQSLVYKGRRRSHRFTIHSDTSFEYDCILNKEPESNVISLLMEGAEGFDFFRQPDFVSDPFLKGSYAVYKKEALLGEGTGKLCHIHRPEIVDARGRRCWGELAVIGNELRITIPKNWLSEAAYPVIVDPIIGTTTVGRQYLWDHDPPEPWVPLQFEVEIPVNRFLVTETLNGNCTAYFYTNDDEWEAGGYPVIYSDNFNQPHLRRSQNESRIDFEVRSNKPKGWRSGAFSTNVNIPSGTHIWFGCFTHYFWFTRFDYGGVFHNSWWSGNPVIPNSYPGYTGSNRNLSNLNFKLSMYFTYSAAQNYVRILTQGINLSDTGKLTADYKRSTKETVQAKTTVSKFKILCSYIQDTVQAADSVFRNLLLTTRIVTQVFIRDYLLARFLKSRQEIVLKSCVCREIILDSKIG
jgi:hypothetical protein